MMICKDRAEEKLKFIRFECRLDIQQWQRILGGRCTTKVAKYRTEGHLHIIKHYYYHIQFDFETIPGDIAVGMLSILYLLLPTVNIISISITSPIILCSNIEITLSYFSFVNEHNKLIEFNVNGSASWSSVDGVSKGQNELLKLLPPFRH